METSLTGKTILITGATHGLGKSLAHKLSSLGATLILVARDTHKLEALKSDLPHSAFLYPCNMRNSKEVRSCASAVLKGHAIDILINNAGIWTDNELETKRPELRQAALETNVLGHIELTEALLPTFLKKNSGHILNVVSTSGSSDSPSSDNSEWRTYGATKWALRGYTNALISTCNDTHVRVTGFYPGGFNSDIFETAGTNDGHDQPWMMQVDDVADTVIFALTRPADVQVEALLITKKVQNRTNGQAS